MRWTAVYDVICWVDAKGFGVEGADTEDSFDAVFSRETTRMAIAQAIKIGTR
jgi:hypothetical protein